MQAMRSAWFVFAAMGALALSAGCGGSTFTSGGGDDGGTDGTSKDGGGGADAAGEGGGGGDATTDGIDCNALLMVVAAARHRARECSSGSTSQCSETAKDFCCAISVNDSSAQSTKDFEAAVATYTAACGPMACPAIPCPAAPSKTCSATGQCQ